MSKRSCKGSLLPTTGIVVAGLVGDRRPELTTPQRTPGEGAAGPKALLGQSNAVRRDRDRERLTVDLDLAPDGFVELRSHANNYPQNGPAFRARVPVPGCRFQVPSSKFPVPSSKFQVKSSQFPVPSSKFPVPSEEPPPGTRNLEPGTLEPGTWNLELGTRNLEPVLCLPFRRQDVVHV